MTRDTSAGATHGKAELQIELTGFELLSLLSLGDQPGAQATREHLRLPQVATDSPLLGAGVSSLLVRGMGVMNGAVLEPQGDLRALVTVLRGATRWLEVTVVAGPDKTAVGGALLVGSPGGGVMLEPRPFSIWQAWPLAPTDTLPTVGARIVEAHHDQQQDRPLAARLSLTGDGGDRVVAVRYAADESVQVASGANPAESVDPGAVSGVLIARLS